jgi:hypothetical protein
MKRRQLIKFAGIAVPVLAGVTAALGNIDDVNELVFADSVAFKEPPAALVMYRPKAQAHARFLLEQKAKLMLQFGVGGDVMRTTVTCSKCGTAHEFADFTEIPHVDVTCSCGHAMVRWIDYENPPLTIQHNPGETTL